MSYILDALKHSQDSRSRGEVPDLASQLASGRQRASRRERLWRTIALVAVLLLLALLVSLGWQRWLVAPAPESVPAPLAVQPAQPAAAPPVAVAAPAVPVVPSAPVAPVAPAPAAAPAAPAATPASVAPPAAANVQAPGLAALHELAGVRVKVDAPEPPAAGAVGSPPPQAVQALDLPVEVGRVAPSAAVPAAPAGVRSPLLPLPGRPAVSSQTVELRSAPQPSTEEALSAEFGAVEHWKKLPATVQQQLRDMPFNVHIYASDPKLRFVKSGGRTVREGDPLNADLRMLHITRDGVIVGYKGGKYWMRLS